MTHDEIKAFIEKELDLGRKGLNLVFIRESSCADGAVYFHSDAYDQHVDYKFVPEGAGGNVYSRESCGDDWQYETCTDSF